MLSGVVFLENRNGVAGWSNRFRILVMPRYCNEHNTLHQHGLPVKLLSHIQVLNARLRCSQKTPFGVSYGVLDSDLPGAVFVVDDDTLNQLVTSPSPTNARCTVRLGKELGVVRDRLGILWEKNRHDLDFPIGQTPHDCDASACSHHRATALYPLVATVVNLESSLEQGAAPRPLDDRWSAR